MNTHEIAMHIQTHQAPAVLATLIEVEGHSYRKAGAVMLFFEEGTIGSLSPGCLENDLQLRTSEIWERGLPEIVEYNMLSPDDLSWGEVIGCGGKIKVVLEPVQGQLYKLLVQASDRLARGEKLILFREAVEKGFIYKLELDPDIVLPQSKKHPKLSHSAKESLAAGRFMAAPAELTAFHTSFVPKPRLVIFGGGRDVVPIAKLADRVGFRVAVADWREGSLHNKFPRAEQVICSPMEVVQRLGVAREDYVLICSHQLGRDRQFLESVIPLAPLYIGIIGSKARISLLLEGFEVPASLHAPVGLPIGGEGPEEIAVSIIAEIIQIRRVGSRELPKGADSIEGSRNIFGSGAEQADGRVQGFTEIVAGGLTRERRA
ncbi:MULTISPECIES: XdhC family protein [Paenibacillus]|uniref:XdhC family protein n=1 Tax=Paenibacillus TaxID=44249 RepID=UPI002DB98DE0|nr:XdhC family protein [Paenibacillus odorifer]MEC0130123.1 XdhC family protein [Paenibacillus odorifer]MEC0223028.1 XdhC family protein [Paenibacillus odorifer]